MAQTDLQIIGDLIVSQSSLAREAQKIQRAVGRIDFGGVSRNNPFGYISRDVDQFNNSLRAAEQRVFAFGATLAVFTGIPKILKEIGAQFIKVEDRIANINVILNASGPQLRRFTNDLFKIGQDTKTTFDTVSTAALEFSRQGLGIQETLQRTRDSLIAVRLSGLGAEEVVQGLTAAVNTFGKEALSTTEIISKLAAVDAAFAVSTRDLIQSIGRVGNTAQETGTKFDDLLGIITAVQQRTARGGSVISNAIRTIFVRIQRTDTLKALEDLGIAVQDIEGNTLPALNILNQLAQRFDSLSDSERAYISEKVAGVRQINILQAALRDLGSQYSITEAATLKAANATDEATRRNELLNKTVAAQANKTVEILKNAARQVGELAAKPLLERVFGGGQDLGSGISKLFPDNQETANIGQRFGQGILKGIGSVLAGPGLVLGATLLAKVTKQISQSAVGSFGNLFNRPSEKTLNTESAIADLLQRQGPLINKINSSNLTREQKQAQILALVRAEVIETERLVALRRGLAPAIIKGGFVGTSGGGFKRAADGILPAMIAEQQAVSRGVGGATASAKPVLKHINMGSGRTPVVVNTHEKIIRDFMGSGQDAVFNREMMSQAGGNLSRFGRVENVAMGKVPKQYAYHVTTQDRAFDIANDKLRTFKPWYGTEQGSWPDGSTKKRAYFTRGKPGLQFQPEGKLAILRTPITRGFKTENTGDLYVRSPLDSKRLEIQIGESWVPIKQHFGVVASGHLPNLAAGKGAGKFTPSLIGQGSFRRVFSSGNLDRFGRVENVAGGKMPKAQLINKLHSSLNHENSSHLYGIRRHMGPTFDPKGISLEESLGNERFGQLIANAFLPARQILKENFGNTVPLYRAEEKSVSLKDYAKRKHFSYTLDKKTAKEHVRLSDNKILTKTDVPIDSIKWFTNEGGEAEFLVNTAFLQKPDAKIKVLRHASGHLPNLAAGKGAGGNLGRFGRVENIASGKVPNFPSGLLTSPLLSSISNNLIFGKGVRKKDVELIEGSFKGLDTMFPGLKRFLQGMPERIVQGKFDTSPRQVGGKLIKELALVRGSGGFATTTGQLHAGVDASNAKLFKDELDYIFRHELGHIVHYNSGEAFVPWANLYREQLNRMPTGYAKSNEREGFADSFSAFTSPNQEIRKRLTPEISHFFDKGIRQYIYNQSKKLPQIASGHLPNLAAGKGAGGNLGRFGRVENVAVGKVPSRVNSLRFSNNKDAEGVFPYQQDINYFGKVGQIDPKLFRKLVVPITDEQLRGRDSYKYIMEAIKSGKEIAYPALYLNRTKSGVLKVAGHEGRMRSLIAEEMGFDEIPVALLGTGMGMRSKHFDPNFIEELKRVIPEMGKRRIVSGITVPEDPYSSMAGLLFPQTQRIASGHLPNFASGKGAGKFTPTLIGAGSFRRVFSTEDPNVVRSVPRDPKETLKIMEHLGGPFDEKAINQLTQQIAFDRNIRPLLMHKLSTQGLAPKVFGIQPNGEMLLERIYAPTLKDLMGYGLLNKKQQASITRQAKIKVAKALGLGVGATQQLDLNPGNITLDDRGGIKVLDFAKGRVPNFAYFQTGQSKQSVRELINAFLKNKKVDKRWFSVTRDNQLTDFTKGFALRRQDKGYGLGFNRPDIEYRGGSTVFPDFDPTQISDITSIRRYGKQGRTLNFKKFAERYDRMFGNKASGHVPNFPTGRGGGRFSSIDTQLARSLIKFKQGSGYSKGQVLPIKERNNLQMRFFQQAIPQALEGNDFNRVIEASKLFTQMFPNKAGGRIPNFSGHIPGFAKGRIPTRYSLGYGQFRPNILGLKDLFKNPKEVLGNLPRRVLLGAGAGVAGLVEAFKPSGSHFGADPYFSASRYLLGLGGVRTINTSQVALRESMAFRHHNDAKRLDAPEKFQVDGLEGLSNTIGTATAIRRRGGVRIQDPYDFDNSVEDSSFSRHGVSKGFYAPLPPKVSKILQKLFDKIPKGHQKLNKLIKPFVLKSSAIDDNDMEISGKDLDFAKLGTPFLTRINAKASGYVPNFAIRDIHRGYVKNSLDQGLYGDRTIGGRSLSEEILENLNKRPFGRNFLFDALSGAGALPGYTYATSLSKDIASRFAGSGGGLSSAKIRILSKEGNKRLLARFNKQNKDISYNDYLINLASSKPFGVKREGGFAHEQEVRVLDPYKLVKFQSSGFLPYANKGLVPNIASGYVPNFALKTRYQDITMRDVEELRGVKGLGLNRNNLIDYAIKESSKHSGRLAVDSLPKPAWKVAMRRLLGMKTTARYGDGHIPNFANLRIKPHEIPKYIMGGHDIQSLVYESKSAGGLQRVLASQHSTKVRHDLKVGDNRTLGDYASWTDRQLKNQYMTIRGRFGDNTEPTIKNIKWDKMREIHAHGNVYTIDRAAGGYIPNFAITPSVNVPSFRAIKDAIGRESNALSKMFNITPNHAQRFIKVGFDKRAGGPLVYNTIQESSAADAVNQALRSGVAHNALSKRGIPNFADGRLDADRFNSVIGQVNDLQQEKDFLLKQRQISGGKTNPIVETRLKQIDRAINNANQLINKRPVARPDFVGPVLPSKSELKALRKIKVAAASSIIDPFERDDQRFRNIGTGRFSSFPSSGSQRGLGVGIEVIDAGGTEQQALAAKKAKTYVPAVQRQMEATAIARQTFRQQQIDKAISSRPRIIRKQESRLGTLREKLSENVEKGFEKSRLAKEEATNLNKSTQLTVQRANRQIQFNKVLDETNDKIKLGEKLTEEQARAVKRSIVASKIQELPLSPQQLRSPQGVKLIRNLFNQADEELNKETAKVSKQKEISNLTEKATRFRGGKAAEAQLRKLGANEEANAARQARRTNLQGMGFQAAFAVPFLAQIITSTLGTETRRARQVGGIAEAAGTGTLVASLAGFGTGGIAAGVGVAGLGALKAIIDNLTPSFEDLRKKAEELSAGQQAQLDAVQSFLQLQSQIETLQKSGGSEARVQSLIGSSTQILRGVKSPKLRAALTLPDGDERDAAFIDTQQEFLQEKSVAESSTFIAKLRDEQKTLFGLGPSIGNLKKLEEFGFGAQYLSKGIKTFSRNPLLGFGAPGAALTPFFNTGGKTFTNFDDKTLDNVVSSLIGSIPKEIAEKQTAKSIAGVARSISLVNTESEGANEELIKLAEGLGFPRELLEQLSYISEGSDEFQKALRILNDALITTTKGTDKAKVRFDEFARFYRDPAIKGFNKKFLAQQESAQIANIVTTNQSKTELSLREGAGQIIGPRISFTDQLELARQRSQEGVLIEKQSAEFEIEQALRGLAESLILKLDKTDVIKTKDLVLGQLDNINTGNPRESIEKFTEFLSGIENPNADVEKLIDGINAELSKLNIQATKLVSDTDAQTKAIQIQTRIQAAIAQNTRRENFLGGVGGLQGIDFSQNRAGFSSRISRSNRLLSPDSQFNFNKERQKAIFGGRESIADFNLNVRRRNLAENLPIAQGILADKQQGIFFNKDVLGDVGNRVNPRTREILGKIASRDTSILAKTLGENQELAIQEKVSGQFGELRGGGLNERFERRFGNRKGLNEVNTLVKEGRFEEAIAKLDKLQSTGGFGNNSQLGQDFAKAREVLAKGKGETELSKQARDIQADGALQAGDVDKYFGRTLEGLQKGLAIGELTPDALTKSSVLTAQHTAEIRTILKEWKGLTPPVLTPPATPPTLPPATPPVVPPPALTTIPQSKLTSIFELGQTSINPKLEDSLLTFSRLPEKRRRDGSLYSIHSPIELERQNLLPVPRLAIPFEGFDNINPTIDGFPARQRDFFNTTSERLDVSRSFPPTADFSVEGVNTLNKVVSEFTTSVQLFNENPKGLEILEKRLETILALLEKGLSNAQNREQELGGVGKFDVNMNFDLNVNGSVDVSTPEAAQASQENIESQIEDIKSKIMTMASELQIAFPPKKMQGTSLGSTDL